MCLNPLARHRALKFDLQSGLAHMTQNPLSGLVIRTAIVRRAGLGYIYASDPKKEAEDVPHTIIFKYKEGRFERGDNNYNAHSICGISRPQPGLIDVSGAGYYTVNSAAGVEVADIFENSLPPPTKPRTGGIRGVAEVGGQAFAVGLRGIVYRYDGPKNWRRIDEGLPASFDGQAIHGFAADDLYAVGREGQIWHFDGSNWRAEDSPTSTTLTCVTCAPNGKVYAAGHRGVLVEGHAGTWRVVDTEVPVDNIWDVEWFAEKLYVSTMGDVYTLGELGFSAVDFGADRPKSCYQLSSANGVLWSNGEFDLMLFDGINWKRIV